jgi:hypothetical protein
MASSLPIKNKSGYLLYCGDVRETIKSNHPEIKSVEIVKKMGEGWKALSDGQKKEYETKAAQDKERFLKEKEQWTAANPDVVIPEKKTRKRTKKEVAPAAAAAAVVEEIVVEDHELVQEEPAVAPKKRGKKAAVKVAVDGTPLVAAAAPVVEPVVVEPVVVAEDKKKPLNKFQNFCSIQRAKLKVEKPQLKPKEVTTELGALWKALSPQEQEAFSA